MDRLILTYMRSFVGRSRLLDRLMIHIAKKGPLWFFLVLGVFAANGGVQARWVVLQSIVAATLARGVNEGIGRMAFRDRPFVREGFQPLIQHRPDSSFPSNHAAGGFALAIPVCLQDPTFGLLLVTMAMILAYSRLYVGVHYPADVIAGAMVGTVLALGTSWLLAI